MASLSHLAAGALCGAAYARRTNSHAGLSVAAFAALALSPDLDFFAEAWGADGTPLDHRVMTHSLPFALGIGLVLGLLLAPPRHKWVAAALAVAALASHGLLDAITNNDPSPQLFWPFLARPFGFGWRPIPGTQSYQEYFMPEARGIFLVEGLMLLPVLILTAWILWPRRTDDKSRA